MFYLYFPTDEWLRPLLKQDKQVLVHWWYYPDRFVLCTLYKLKIILKIYSILFIFFYVLLICFLKLTKVSPRNIALILHVHVQLYMYSCACTAVHAAGKTHSQVESLFSTG